MTGFSGFPEGKTQFIHIPIRFFSDLLPLIDHLGEMKVTLYAFWFVNQQETAIRFITAQNYLDDADFMKSLSVKSNQAVDILKDSLERAVLRNTFLKAIPENKSFEDTIYFLNTPRGRAAVESIELGQWSPENTKLQAAQLKHEKPNIFRLYEENIGIITPMIAEDLIEAEQTYPAPWIEEAMHIAVQNNARNWKYIEKILQSWQQEGRHGSNQQDTKEDRFKYIKGKYADFGEY